MPTPPHALGCPHLPGVLRSPGAWCPPWCPASRGRTLPSSGSPSPPPGSAPHPPFGSPFSCTLRLSPSASAPGSCLQREGQLGTARAAWLPGTGMKLGVLGNCGAGGCRGLGAPRVGAGTSYRSMYHSCTFSLCLSPGWTMAEWALSPVRSRLRGLAQSTRSTPRAEANHATVTGPACPSRAVRWEQGGPGSSLSPYFSTDSPGSWAGVNVPMVMQVVLEEQRSFRSQVHHPSPYPWPHLVPFLHAAPCPALPVHPTSISFSSRLSLRSWVS